MSTVRESQEARMSWWRELPKTGKRAVAGAFLGYCLGSYDFWVFSLSLAAIGTTFRLSSADRGWLSTATLVASALGGVLAGVLADRIGGTKTLVITILAYSLFT